MNRMTRNPERLRSAEDERRGPDQSTRMREAVARRRLEELREQRTLRDHLSDVFGDDGSNY